MAVIKWVYDSLKSDLKKIEGRENKALANLYLAEAALNLKKYNETVNICDQLTEDNYSNEKWIVPMADLLNAKAKFFSGDRTGAKDHLEDAEDNNEHDFKDYIQSQIEWLKRRIR